jgi:hypothetical protein
MFILSSAMMEHLAYRLAARTGLQLKTCRNILAGRYRKYNRGIQLRAAEGIRSILSSDGGSPVVYADSGALAPKDSSFLGNLASAIVAGYVQFGSNLATHAAKGFVAWVTGASAGTGNSEEGEGEGDGEGEGEEGGGEEK